MSLPQIATRDEWLAARRALLVKEKDLTRRRDALNAERRMLPMVEIDKDYVFEGPAGRASLLDLFEGRRTPAGPSRPAARTTSSTSRPSAGRRTGRSPRAGRQPRTRRARTSRADAPAGR